MANTKKSRGLIAAILILALLVIDQVIKIWVKTNMPLYDTIEITSWFKIHYIENNGMAFGMTFVNKLVLSLFRIAAIALLCYYISLLVRRGCRVSYFVPFGDGYAPFLMGKVVDMFYFPLIESTFPDWLPIWGGEDYIFFSPVFNFADACVSVGVVAVLIFYQKELTELFKDEKPKEESVSAESDLNE